MYKIISLIKIIFINIVFLIATMDRDNIIDYFNEYSGLKPNILDRELEVPTDSKFIISLFGPRRAGKTFYFFQLEKTLEKPFYLNFEDSRLYSIKANEIRDIIRIYIENFGAEPRNIMFDEIQNVAGWESIVRELYDVKKYGIFITGSSSKLMSSEIATQLRGRSLSYLMLPFSFREFLTAKKIMPGKYHTKDDEAKLRKLLSEYLEFGGFPEVVLNEDKIKILKEYSELALFRDFIERHKAKNMGLARYLHETMIQNFSKEASIRSFFEKAKSSGIKISNNTVYDYIDKLRDTSLFFFINRYSKKPHLRASWPKKIYIADTGLSKTQRFSEDKGRLLENAVFLEFLRRKNANPLLDIYYFSEHDVEIDFLLKSADKVIQLVQVTYELTDKNYRREVMHLIKVSKEVKCRNLLILTWNDERIIQESGATVKAMPLWKWLLTKEPPERLLAKVF